MACFCGCTTKNGCRACPLMGHRHVEAPAIKVGDEPSSIDYTHSQAPQFEFRIEAG